MFNCLAENAWNQQTLEQFFTFLKFIKEKYIKKLNKSTLSVTETYIEEWLVSEDTNKIPKKSFGKEILFF